MTKVNNKEWIYIWDVPAGFNNNHTVSILATDVAGNENSAATGKTIYTIDNIIPGADIAYSTTAPTSGNVTATISFDEENVTITNHDSNEYLFTENAEFIFNFVDIAGNT